MIKMLFSGDKKKVKIKTEHFIIIMTFPKKMYMIQTYHIPVLLIAKEKMLNVEIDVYSLDDVRVRIEPDFINLVDEGRGVKLDLVVSSDTKGKKKIVMKLSWNDAFYNKYSFERMIKMSFKI